MENILTAGEEQYKALKLYLEDKRTPGNRKGATVSPRGERSANGKQTCIYCHILILPEPSGKKKNGKYIPFFYIKASEWG